MDGVTVGHVPAPALTDLLVFFHDEAVADPGLQAARIVVHHTAVARGPA